MKAREFMRMLDSNKIHVFTLSEAAKIINKTPSYVSLFLSSLDGIKRIERGKYYVEGADPNLIASNIVYPSYISLVSALSYYKSITQMPVSIAVMSLRQHGELSIEGYRVRFVKIKRSRFFGYRNDDGIFIATPEKAILDCLLFNIDFFYVSASFGVLKEDLDINKLKDYARLMDNKALINRLGFLMEKYGLDAEDLLPYRSRMYTRLSDRGKEKDRRWRILHANEI